MHHNSHFNSCRLVLHAMVKHLALQGSKLTMQSFTDIGRLNVDVAAEQDFPITRHWKTTKKTITRTITIIMSKVCGNGFDATPCQSSCVSCAMAKDHVVKLILHGNHLIEIILKLIGLPNANSESNMHGMFASNGNVIGLCRLAHLKVVDLPYNFFGGIVTKCLLHLPSVNFQGNCLDEKSSNQHSDAQCGAAVSAKGHPNPSGNTNGKSRENETKHQKWRPTWLLALKIVTGTMVGTLFITALNKSSVIIPWKKSGIDKERLAVYIADSELLRDIHRYNRQELKVACEDSSNTIGSSSDSMIYKGTMKGGSEIAVLSFCIKEEQWTGYHELYFKREEADLARLNHENAAKLLGYCRESPPFTRMLVFEHACNRTLYEHLHSIFADGEGCQLSWTRHISELNSSAVYLTEDFSPKLVDYESWKTIIARSEKKSSAIDSNGAICVLPRSFEARHLDIKGNVYAFGVLLLEIVSGRPPFSKDTGSLVDWAREYLEVPEVMSYVVEKELKHFEYEDLKAVCEAASQTTNDARLMHFAGEPH